MAQGVTLRTPQTSDAAEFVAQVLDSRELHALWVNPPADVREFSDWLAKTQSESQVSFLVVQQTKLAGVVNVTNVVRGNFCSAYLGYYAFARSARTGVMTEGLRKVCRHAFNVMGLHRLEANIQPANTASIALAKRCGFKLEGYSPKYLKVRGRWRDHERWALVKP